MNDDRPKQGMTSVEAAALILSQGKTKDPALAEALSTGQDLDMEALQRAHLRRMMGFDFRIKVQPNKIHVSSKQEPYVTTWCRLNEGDAFLAHDGPKLTNEKVVDRLVDACARLKVKYDAEVARLGRTT